MNAPPATGQPSRDITSPTPVFQKTQAEHTPASIAASLEAKFSALGSRAQQAVALYIAGEVRPISRSQTLHDDRWKVCGCTVSISGKYCTCDDADAAPRHNGGPLCEHRIAAMMQQRLGAPDTQSIFGPSTDAAQRLTAIFTEANKTKAEQVRLRVRVMLTWNRATEQENVCEGYLLPGEGRIWQTLEASAERAAITGAPATFPFTLSELAQAIDGQGWQYESKNRAAGGGANPRMGLDGWINEIWYFVPTPARLNQFGPVIRTRIGAVTA